MTRKLHGEADTRAKLITPALHQRGWREDDIVREETDPAIEFGADGRPRRVGGRRADYLLTVAVPPNRRPVPVALLEAKSEASHPGKGIEQVREYARKCPKFNVPFLYSSNGHLFVEFDLVRREFSAVRPMAEFPAPAELRARYEAARGVVLDDPPAAPLLFPYSGNSGKPRYYQDAAIRAAMEEIARCARRGAPARVLLSLATGAGKTFIAANLLRRLADAGQLRRALFLCDRVALRDQALGAFQKEFGDEVAVVEEARGRNAAQNARIHIATYQTLGADRDDGPAAYRRFYPDPGHFSHIVIDECHRSAWRKWSIPLAENPRAAHIGLTATPREFKPPRRADRSPEAQAFFLRDQSITAHNRRYFGDPAYEYSIADGVADGYLAACRAGLLRPNLDIRGLAKPEVLATNPVDALTGEAARDDDIAEKYPAPAYEADILLPDRVNEMSADLFRRIIQDDPKNSPDQKTIIFCVNDSHADRVARAMQNLRAQWAQQRDQRPPRHYAFKCTADSHGADMLPDFRGNFTDFCVAVTVDLLTTGVDVPPVRNIAFFRYLKSPIAFRQMLGRGTRLHKPTGKLAFAVYDYTGAFDLLGEELVAPPPRKSDKKRQPDDYQPRRQILSEGYDVWVNELAAAVMVRDDNGGERWMPLDEYKTAVAQRLLQSVKTPEALGEIWTRPAQRRELLTALARAGLPPAAAMHMERRETHDLYDYLRELAWSADPVTRRQRADQFRQNNAAWLAALNPDAAKIVAAVVAVFEDGGTDQLESAALFDSPKVAAAGGRNALNQAGNPAATMTEMKRRLFAG